jgi:[acyl-carrier-protein] S-malonyltransferase
MNHTIACLFPAFAMKYKEFDRTRPAGVEERAQALLERASELVEIDPRKFADPVEFVLDDPLQDDLQDQFACYVDNCAVAGLLDDWGVPCDYVAGYSMGVFAAMHRSAAVSFEDGLRLLRHTCTCVQKTVDEGDFGMGVIVGFTPGEAAELIAANGGTAEVADVCGRRVVILSGRRPDLKKLLEVAEDEGAMQSKLLPVAAPFHSSLLAAVEEPMRDFLPQVEIRPPRCPIVSCVDQRLLVTADDVKDEAAKNVSRPIHWYKTMKRLLELGVGCFAECGFSDSLCNLARNVEGDYRICHPRMFDRYFPARNGGRGRRRAACRRQTS